MKSACGDWDASIWEPGSPPIQGRGFEDGPFVPVDLTRQSSDGRITLVVQRPAVPAQVLWALMLPTELRAAREALRDREDITGNNWMSRIGSWQRGEAAPETMSSLPDLAQADGLDTVRWTALGPRFNGAERSPAVGEVVE